MAFVGQTFIWLNVEKLLERNRYIHETVEDFCNVGKVLLGSLVHLCAGYDSVPELYSLELLVWFLNESSDETLVFSLESKHKLFHKEERQIFTNDESSRRCVNLQV